MCSSTASVGVTQDTGRSEQAVGATASHELGHIMNMDHDDRGESVCVCVCMHVCVCMCAYVCA